MAKVVKAKWGIGSDKPEDLPDFLSNDEILEKNGDRLPRGRFRLHVKEILVVKNSNDDDMLKIRAEIDETDKEKKSYNGYFIQTQQNITDQGKPYLLKFLKALGVTWNDFMDNTRQTPETTVEPAKILSIGAVKFTTGKVYAMGLLGVRQWKEEDRTDLTRWIPKGDNMPTDEEDDEAEAEELEDDGELEDGEEDEAEAEDMSDEEAELREELEDLTLAKLKARAKENGAKVADYKGLDEAGVINLIVEQEIEEEEDDEAEGDEDASEAEEELREELSELTIAQLKSRCRANKRKLAEYKTAKEPELIEMIVEDELGADGNEPPF